MKVARAVLKGGGGGNAADLLGKNSIMKRTTLKTLTISIFAHIVVFMCIVSVILFSSCRSQLRVPSFILQEEVVRIPLRIENERFFSYVVVESDTVRMIIDTGSTMSLFNYESAVRTRMRTQATGGGGFSGFLPIGKVHTMQWGGLKIGSLPVAQESINIIGDDILRHFIVQFDNENQEIVLTQNASLIEKRGIRVPFSRGDGGNRVDVSLSLNGKEGVFLLDTGYTGELRVDSVFFYSSGLSDLENVRWRGYLGGSLFMPESLRREGVLYMAIVRHELGGMIFDNAIVTRCIRWHSNVFGFVFLQRFRTFTIDYINGYVYLELPEGTTFSDDNVIETVPPAYSTLLRRKINSFGIRFHHRADASTVSSLLKDDAFAKIEIGDTLVGINQTAFNEAAFYKLGADTDSFNLADRFVRITELSSANEATFHFLKNGELVSIDRTRDRVLYPEPRVVRMFVPPMEAMLLQMREDGYILESVAIDNEGNMQIRVIDSEGNVRIKNF